MVETLPKSIVRDAEPGLISRKSSPRLPAKVTEEVLVLERVIRVIGNRKEALRWMGTPVRLLGYATPVSLLATAKGRDSLLNILGKLEHGVL